MIKLSSEIVPNPHAPGYICRVQLREKRGGKMETSTMAVAKGTPGEAWSECAKWVRGFMPRSKRK